MGEDISGFSKFSAPTIAFLAFWLAKKLLLWAIIIQLHFVEYK